MFSYYNKYESANTRGAHSVFPYCAENLMSPDAVFVGMDQFGLL